MTIRKGDSGVHGVGEKKSGFTAVNIGKEEALPGESEGAVKNETEVKVNMHNGEDKGSDMSYVGKIAMMNDIVEDIVAFIKVNPSAKKLSVCE